MRVKVQKYNGRLLGCCISIPPEMMESLGGNILNDYIELAIEKTSDGLFIKRIEGVKEVISEHREAVIPLSNSSIMSVAVKNSPSF